MRLGMPAVPHFERALRLNPRDVRAPFAQNGLALAYLWAANYLKAAELAEGVLRQLPRYPPAMFTVIAARAHAGEIESARAAAKILLEMLPATRISTMVDSSQFPGYQRILVEGYRLAGLPE